MSRGHALVAASLLVGCGGAAVPYRPSAKAEAPAERLVVSPGSLTSLAATPEDAIVRVVTDGSTCTGTLVDEDLVLTAHHCVVERGPRGEYTAKRVAPGSLHVELGGDYFAWGEVSVRHVIAPPCGERGGAGDIALLVLSRKLVGLGTITPRLDAAPRVGEKVHPVGFGRCALTADGIRRRTRAGGPIRAVAGGTLELEASICPGDSGGPLLSQGSGDVVGVVSLSAMDHDETTRGSSVMARLDAYRMVWNHARMIADGASPAELPPLECAAEPTPPGAAPGRAPSTPRARGARAERPGKG